MSKARDLANAGTALGAVSATELGYVDGVTSAIQTQIDSKEATLPSQTGNSGKYLTTNGTAKSWGTVSQYALPSQTGNSGKFLTTNGTAESWGTVTTPTTFNHRTNIGEPVKTIAYNGSNLYVAAGGGGKLSTSPDGITWTARTSGFGSSNISAVAFGNGLWVAVGQSGTITTSTDGITWTARTSNFSTNLLYDVKYANSVWVAVGAGGGATNTGGITYSTDGITWTRKSQTLTVGTNYYSVVYNGTNWIVGAGSTTNNYLYASTPSGTWTVGADGSGSDILYIFWDGTRNIVNTESAGLRYSTSTTLGTTTRFTGLDVITAFNRLYYYNGNIYFNGFFIGSISTTPMTGNYPQINYSILSPSTWNTSGNPGITESVNSGAIWVGASGIIVGSSTNAGQIFTSF